MCVCVHVLQLNVLVDEKHPELSNGVWGWAGFIALSDEGVTWDPPE